MARNNVGIMPIHAASLGGHTPMGKLLLENGAPPRTRSPPPHAPTPGPPLRAGTEIDAKDTYWTALHNASRGGHASFVELLLVKGARPNVLGLEGNTPLHHAALEGHYKALPSPTPTPLLAGFGVVPAPARGRGWEG
jgi:ankyrin repeat protein